MTQYYDISIVIEEDRINDIRLGIGMSLANQTERELLYDELGLPPSMRKFDLRLEGVNCPGD